MVEDLRLRNEVEQEPSLGENSCLKTKKAEPVSSAFDAERLGFEPRVQSPVRRISSAVHSTTLASLQCLAKVERLRTIKSLHPFVHTCALALMLDSGGSPRGYSPMSPNNGEPPSAP